MILFKKLRYKNFLSSGNKFTELDFRDSKHTLVVGHNGAGKSTMLDALSYGLFGKAHRNINKPQLINSINKKNMLVEVEFSIGKQEYFIKRGMSPGVFEIYVNGSMLDQSSTNRDYQKILEQNILKLNHKSFHQIVVLGSSSFIPFMQLPQGHRRSVIEDLLDINMFSKMNYLLRERNGILKDKIKESGHQVEILESKRDSQKKYIRDLTKLNNEYRKEKEDQVKKLSDEVESLQADNVKIVSIIKINRPDIEVKLQNLTGERQSLLENNGQITSEIKSVVKEAKFYDSYDECPTCHQEIDEDTKDSAKQSAKEKARLLSLKKDASKKKFVEVESALESVTKSLNEVNKFQEEVNANISKISTHQKTIQGLEKELGKTSSSVDLENATVELSTIETSREKLIEEKFKLSDEYNYNNVMGEMLKDTGIKTKVIKQYVPIINKLVNQYLQVLDFFVSFNLDEQFVEEIKSRYRDSFSYASFSEGEKQRIDLALLFTWRQIAKMKNSVATNLLILDETFDSSLDHDGVENLMKILYTLSDDSNVFVISHKGEILEGKFEKKIEFEKRKNFSVMI